MTAAAARQRTRRSGRRRSARSCIGFCVGTLGMGARGAGGGGGMCIYGLARMGRRTGRRRGFVMWSWTSFILTGRSMSADRGSGGFMNFTLMIACWFLSTARSDCGFMNNNGAN